MKAQHTPGPWLVAGNQRNGHFDFVLPCADNKDFQANCRLISAAPELLAALESIHDINPDDEGNRIIPPGFMDAARAAIKKARGKT